MTGADGNARPAPVTPVGGEFPVVVVEPVRASTVDSAWLAMLKRDHGHVAWTLDRPESGVLVEPATTEVHGAGADREHGGVLVGLSDMQSNARVMSSRFRDAG